MSEIRPVERRGDDEFVDPALPTAEEQPSYAQRPSYKPEEGAPDTASEVGSILRAVLVGALVLAVLAALITLWRR